MDRQLRVMLDTNVYEFLELQYLDPLSKLINEKKIVIYGCRVVRKELRDIPRTAKLKGKSLRNILLGIYDKLTQNHDYQLDSIAENIAEQYWKEYEGGISKRKLMDDFKIVAISSMHNLDIIVSEDNHSMASGSAKTAFSKANKINQLREPVFYSLKEFAKLL